MFHVARYLSLALCCVVAALFVAGSAGAVDDREGVLVGRVSHVEGKLLRYVEEENDWVLTVKDAPFGLDDALYSGEDAKAEFIMPSGAWMRVGANTQMQLIDMNMDATTLDVASGMARFYNKSRNGVIKTTTPFGYVVAPAGSAFDLYVGDESMEVIAVRGTVDFVHDATGSRFPVREGGESIIADRQGTAQGNGAVDGDWDDWNGYRDSVWAEREQSRSRMADLLPEPIREESYVFEDNGRWERVQYEGAYRDMWRPVRVDPGWRPFTVGRWTQYYGDNCWIPDEPFGYVTHHYGSWVYVEAFHTWYWMPPVVRRHPNTPSIFISFGWYPGRVGWIHGRESVGWVPLGPNEIYYGHRPWGHRTRVINHNTVNIININKYRYLNEAVVVNRDRLYQGSRYTPHLRRDFDRAELAKSFKPMPMAKAFDNDKRRFAYSDAQVGRKPHAMVAERINSNQKISKDAGRINRARIEKDLTRVKASAGPPPQREMRAPTLSSRLVEAGKTKAPIDRVAAPPKEIKPRERERRITPDNRAGSARPDRRLGDSVEPKRDATGPDESRRTRAPKDEGNALRNPANIAPQTGGAPQGRREPAALDQRRDATGQGDQAQERRIRSPRDRESQGPTPDRSPANLDRRRPTDEPRQPVEQGVQQQGQNDALKARQEQAAGRRGPEDVQRRQQEEQGRRQEQQREIETKPQQGEAVQRPRREEAQQLQQQETQRRQQAEEQGRQQELQRRQQEEQGRRQEQEQQRRQGLEAKQRQEDAAQRQQQEVQRRQQAETQQRQQQEVQRRQQAEEQGRQQELQRRQQEEQGRRQEQEQQRRQGLEAKQRQEESAQRQRQEASQQRQQQEAQRRQQEDAQQRQQQEVQRRQQAEEQGRQQQLQRRQQEEAQQRQPQQQQQQQQEQRKRRKLTPEEELLLKQSAPNQ